MNNDLEVERKEQLGADMPCKQTKKTETNNKPRRSDRKRDFYHYMNIVHQDYWEAMELAFQEEVQH